MVITDVVVRLMLMNFSFCSGSVSISEISLTVAEEGRPTRESGQAHQIEKCNCPIGYAGLSCEVWTQLCRRLCGFLFFL